MPSPSPPDSTLKAHLRTAGVVSLSALLRGVRVWEPKLRRQLQRRLSYDDAERLTALAYRWGRYWAEPSVQRSGLRDFERAFVATTALGAGARWFVPAAGGGRELRALQQLGFDVCGTEPSAPLRAAARELTGVEVTGHRFASLVGDDAHPGPFDAILTGWGAWGHIVRPAGRAQSLAALRRRLRPGGWLCLSWPMDGAQPGVSPLCIMPGGSVTAALTADLVAEEAAVAGLDVRHVWERGYPHVFLQRGP